MLLDIRPLIGMPAQIPAGLHSRVREQSVHAGFRLWRIKDELRLAALLEDRVVVIYRNRPIRVAVGRRSDSEDDEIHAEGEDRHPQKGEQRSNEDSSELFPEIAGLRHGA